MSTGGEKKFKVGIYSKQTGQLIMEFPMESFDYATGGVVSWPLEEEYNMEAGTIGGWEIEEGQK